MELDVIGRIWAVICALFAVALVGCGISTSPATSVVGSAGAGSTTPSQASGAGGASGAGAEAASLRVSFVDVGKGDCILVECAGGAGLIDTGYDSTSDEVLSYLHERGIDRLRFIILTHYDRDHVEGLRAIASALPVDEVCLPNYEGDDRNYSGVMETVKDLGLSTRQAAEGSSYALGEAQLSVLPTGLSYEIEPGEDEGNDNDLSLVVALRFRNDSYLFSGDLEKKGIAAYLDRALGTFDVLKMPHHGGKSGKTEDLVEAVLPRIAIITDGEDDPANKKTLKILEEAGVETYRTSTDGTIVVESHGSGTYETTTSSGSGVK